MFEEQQFCSRIEFGLLFSLSNFETILKGLDFSSTVSSWIRDPSFSFSYYQDIRISLINMLLVLKAVTAQLITLYINEFDILLMKVPFIKCFWNIKEFPEHFIYLIMILTCFKKFQ